MRRLFAIVALSFHAVAAATAHSARVTVSNPDPVVTESWHAGIEFLIAPLEGRYAATCPLSSPSSSPFPSLFNESRTGLAIHGFPIDGVRFSHKIDRLEKDGVNWWRVKLMSDPIPAERPGRIDVGPVTVEASLFNGQFRPGFFSPEPVTVVRRFTAPRVVVTVHEPPREGRPSAYCGAIGSNVTAVARLDANVCTAGDPLILTLSISGATSPPQIRVPSIAGEASATGIFRVDESSVKSRIEGSSRVFTWRVRARKAGTVEFPSLTVAFFDVASRTYRMCRTESIPVQVKAGAQVALGLSDDDADGDGAFPMPDGLDLDFPDAGTADFTFRRAVALARHAATPDAFAAAAKAYADYLSQQPVAPLDRLAPLAVFDAGLSDRLARHCANLGALRLLGGDARGAFEAYSRASAFAGDDPSLLRGMRAACARLRNDPRADLPLSRMLFPFWFRLTLRMRLLVGVLGAIALAFAWWLAGRLGRGGVLVLALAALPALDASAQWPMRRSMRLASGGASEVKVTASTVPEDIFVDVPGALVFSFEVENGVGVESVRFFGLPDPSGGKIEYGEQAKLPPLPVNSSGRVVQRVKVPVRFHAPFEGTISPAVAGMLVTRRGNGTSFSFTSSVNFESRCAPLALKVAPLPEPGRPAGFSGAVGRNFRLRQRLAPAQVHPGDLVTAEYRLDFNGYFPTNMLPHIEGLEGNFKVYEPKETARTGGSVTWRQMLVPQSSAATNAAVLSVDYYDVAAKRYAKVTTQPARLSFISAEAASTENTSVLVDAQSPSAATPSASQPVTLRFAPSDASPAVAVLPPGTELKTLSSQGVWRRVETPKAIGWVR